MSLFNPASASYFIRPPSKPLYEISGFNFKQIESAWSQSIGYWGRRSQIWHLFQEMMMINSKNFFKSKCINSWQISRMDKKKVNKRKNIWDQSKQRHSNPAFEMRSAVCSGRKWISLKSKYSSYSYYGNS